ncbi:bifunctional histidinal dehydrogenase/ histidinol dehydrogenase [Methanocaldococcus villosus KIN24-T80]|uniref:Histidinol dehydrogenase n=1 Tax=Methanocaldococcus villosus KIN24-T80 TaxID=1069083 RepID=N6UWQ9_9EURY|nr:histidinol dehydrogenase [Methanocaldococcus villosus]ENN96779.1 bifunctional histidinal dehydrogenase/ histidinol dehydrogenase [Methanocaldococcus villosus KIN24-T80]
MIVKDIKTLSLDERKKILERNKINFENILLDVLKILKDVRERGDEAIKYYTKKFDNVDIDNFIVSNEEIEEAYNRVDYKIIDALERAKENIYYFHKKQLKQIKELRIEKEGMVLGQVIRAVEKVGCYVPGGKAFYPSTVLMTTIPAKVAGCKKIFITSPPTPEGKGNCATLVAGDIVGVDRIYKIGGVQAIGALAYGTESVEKVDLIVGPGNIYVTLAKKLVYGDVNIDLLAGPSEVLIIADDSANVNYIAIDVIAQAEHDPNAHCVVLTTSKEKAYEIKNTIEKELKNIKRKEIVEKSLKNAAILYGELNELINFANEYAPEHLEIITKDPESVLEKINNAGSIFLGEYSPVPVGDYASGTNHVLPTSGFARAASGLSVETFLKKITYQKLSREGLEELKDTIITLAEAEGLYNHAEAIRRRF